MPLILGAIAVGTVGGVFGARRVQMTQMPQMVALFNGVGGGAAALVALLELHEIVEAGGDPGWFVLVATAFTILVGSVSFAGSVVTFAKLQELMTSAPGGVPRPRARVRRRAARRRRPVRRSWWSTPPCGSASCSPWSGCSSACCWCCPVGGADVPIVISLLNAFTGLTVAAGGYVLGNVVLLVAGTLVGASGTFLTLLMAKAMGRSVANILFGALKGGSTLGAGVASDRPVKSASPEDVAIMLAYADRVIIVPGYGLAVAQAQHTLRELVDVLGERGIEVDYAIHPVAGRMPGHMNVLLAEAQVPYEQLKEMDDINGEFKNADVVLVVGANDVVNPAAKTTPGAPDLRDADPQRRRGQAGRVHEALDAPRLRRHRERAALRREHHPALRRRQGLDGQAAQRGQGPLTRTVPRPPLAASRKSPLIGPPVTYWTEESELGPRVTGGTVSDNSASASAQQTLMRLPRPPTHPPGTSHRAAPRRCLRLSWLALAVVDAESLVPALWPAGGWSPACCSPRPRACARADGAALR